MTRAVKALGWSIAIMVWSVFTLLDCLDEYRLAIWHRERHK